MDVIKGDGSVVTINLPSDPKYFNQVGDLVNSLAAGELAEVPGIDIMALAKKYHKLLDESLISRIKSGKFQHEDQGNTMDVIQNPAGAIRLVVAGSRGFTDYPMFSKTMTSILGSLGWSAESPEEGVVIIEGEAKGPDLMAKQFAIAHGIPFESYPADWENVAVENPVIKENRFGRQYNAAAGHHRNKAMAETGTHLLLFWDGRSKGSDNMLKQARANGLDYLVIRVDAEEVSDEPDLYQRKLPTSLGGESSKMAARSVPIGSAAKWLQGIDWAEVAQVPEKFPPTT